MEHRVHFHDVFRYNHTTLQHLKFKQIHENAFSQFLHLQEIFIKHSFGYLALFIYCREFELI